MANFPPTFYQPQQMPGYGQQMQPQMGWQIPAYQQPPQPAQPQEQALLGRMVTCREEAQGIPVDFGGRHMVFPDLAHGKIYVKVFNPSTGSADFAEYIRADAPAEIKADAVEYAPMSALEELKRELLAEIRGNQPRRRTREEVTADAV